jgi:hypothetical protein
MRIDILIYFYTWISNFRSFDARPADVVLIAYDHIKTYIELPYIDQEQDLQL